MEKLLALVQTMLPQHLLSRLTGLIAGTRFRLVKKLLIHSFIRLYRIDLGEAENSDPDSYESFNALFTRGLRTGARPLATEPSAVVSPVDGTVSQSGPIVDGSLLQAKDRKFTVAQLLGHNDESAGVYENGRFVTIYLAPHDYHRIHTPVAGRLTHMTYIPGRLFSVSPATTRAVANLFARNERVVFDFACADGPMALVMVGAMNVGSIETVHEGIIAPGGRNKRDWQHDPALVFERGQELARFNLGSTVILLFPENGAELSADLHPGKTLRVGEAIGRCQPVSVTD